jgi:hypothetical protein
MQILTAADAAWLSVTYPALQPNTESTEVRGSISFSAGYDEAAGDFAIQRHADVLPPGLVLSGAFDLVIKELARCRASICRTTPIPLRPTGISTRTTLDACAGPPRRRCSYGRGISSRSFSKNWAYPSSTHSSTLI